MNPLATCDPALSFDPSLSRAAAQRLLTRAFTDIGIESATLDARILLSAALGIDHAALVRDPDLLIGDAAFRLDRFFSRRIAREPVSRILGRREFFGETYAIDGAVLDPRPDTECLVGAVLEAVDARKHDALRLLDLGVGSGAILGALLCRLDHAVGFGGDLSPAACQCARANLSALGLKERGFIFAGVWMAPVTDRFDVIVSNPPYIASSDIDALDPEVRLHDPRLALDGGGDGLHAFRTIAAAMAAHLAPDGFAAVEFGEGQRADVEAILRSAGLHVIGCRRDLAGRDRVALMTAP